MVTSFLKYSIAKLEVKEMSAENGGVVYSYILMNVLRNVWRECQQMGDKKNKDSKKDSAEVACRNERFRNQEPRGCCETNCQENRFLSYRLS